MNETDLTQGSVYRVLLRFALPFLLSNLFLALYGAVDLLIIGYFSDAAGISAVANGSQILHTIACFATGLSVGGTVIIGHYAGAKNMVEIVKTIRDHVSCLNRYINNPHPYSCIDGRAYQLPHAGSRSGCGRNDYIHHHMQHRDYIHFFLRCACCCLKRFRGFKEPFNNNRYSLSYQYCPRFALRRCFGLWR